MVLLMTILLSGGILGGIAHGARKTPDFLPKAKKVLSVFLFFVFAAGLLSWIWKGPDSFESTFNLLYVDIETPVDAAATWMFSRSLSLLVFFLRWFTMLGAAWAVVGSFFDSAFVRRFLGTFGLLTGILDAVFFPSLLLAFQGSGDFWTLRGITFFLEIVLLVVLGVLNLFAALRERRKIGIQDVLRFVLVLTLSAVAVFPEAGFYNLFGNYGTVPDDFNFEHLALLLLPFVFLLIAYFAMAKRPQKDRDLMILFLVIAAFFQYFSETRRGLGALPLHLCNAAILLMLVSYVFRHEGIFYFNYFANVLGAFAAILLPSYTQDLFSSSVVHYVFNHFYAFALPVLGVAFHYFERPTLKRMYRALVVFAIYFILMVFLNAFLSNFEPTDYFFTNSDFLSSKFGADALQYRYVASFSAWGLTFTFYYLFQILFFLGFIFLMFMSWYVYDAVFRFSDTYGRLFFKLKRQKMDLLNLRKALQGRKMSEPMNPEGTNLLKISHFTKRYGNSETKAVDDFSLEVHAGEVFGFLGHNGAGKSTTIKSIVGIQSITEGEIEICGYSIKTQPMEAKLRIGYVSDNHAVYEKLTGREYIHYVADLYMVPQDVREKRLEEYLERFSLAYAIDREIKSYSHGMKQKLVVIASLIHDPKVWILDEPLTGLDPTSSFQIKECMRAHADKGNIVFFSSHVIEVVEKICDRIAIIGKGRLEGIYDVKKLLADGDSLENLFMRSVSLGGHGGEK